MKTLLILLMFYYFNSLAQPQKVFEKNYGGNEEEIGYSVLQTQDKGFLVVGYSQSYGIIGDYESHTYIFKTDEFGNKIWQKILDNYSSYALYIKKALDAGYIIVSSSYYPTVITKIDEDGNIMWQKKYSDFSPRGKGLEYSDDNCYVLIGSKDQGIYVTKIDINGNRIWGKSFFKQNNTALPLLEANDIKKTKNGGYAIVGEFAFTYLFPYSLANKRDYDFYFMKIDSSGNKISDKTFTGFLGVYPTPITYDIANSLEATSDGNFIFCGSVENRDSSPRVQYSYMVKVDDSGNQFWSKKYFSNSKCSDVIRTKDNGFMVLGSRLFKTDSQGNLLLEIPIGNTNSITAGQAIEKTSDEGFIITGDTRIGNSPRDIYLMRLAKDTLYKLLTLSQPSNSGSTTGSGEYKAGSSVTVSANQNVGFIFKNWLDLGNPVSSSTTYTFILMSDKTLIANFFKGYSITTSSFPINAGQTTGAGQYEEGASVAITASPNTGYRFINWTEGNNVVSTNSSFTFTLNGDRTLVANFSKNTYTVNLSSNPTSGGTVTGSGTYDHGSSVTALAVAKNITGSKFQFKNWTENSLEVSQNATYTFTITASRNLVANFLDITSVEKEEGTPTKYLLSQNYPNPFNPTTKIQFSLPVDVSIRLSVYNTLGQEIEVLVNEELSVGTYSIDFDAAELPNGIYFYKIQAGKYLSVKKMVLIK